MPVAFRKGANSCKLVCIDVATRSPKVTKSFLSTLENRLEYTRVMSENSLSTHTINEALEALRAKYILPTRSSQQIEPRAKNESSLAQLNTMASLALYEFGIEGLRVDHLPRTVGVKGDQRVYGETVEILPNSPDEARALYEYTTPWKTLSDLASMIFNTTEANRVVIEIPSSENQNS